MISWIAASVRFLLCEGSCVLFPSQTTTLNRRKWKFSHSVVSDSATSWTVDYWPPPSMGFSRQERWVACHFLLQRIFPTQGSNSGLPHCRQTLYGLSRQGSLTTLRGELSSTSWSKECQGIFKKHSVLLDIKKWNLAICDNMDELIYVKWHKSDRGRQILMISLICGI